MRLYTKFSNITRCTTGQSQTKLNSFICSTQKKASLSFSKHQYCNKNIIKITLSTRITKLDKVFRGVSTFTVTSLCVTPAFS